MIARHLDRFAADRWIDTLDIPRACKTLLRCLLTKVDSRTGQSHARFPILQAALSMAIKYSIATICRTFNALEGFGLVIRRRMLAKRLADGTVRQLPTDYELVLPNQCWRFLTPVESSSAARGPAPQPVRTPHHAAWSRTVRGSLSERIEKRELPLARSWKLDAGECHTFIDDMHVDVLAPMLLDAAKLAAESVDETLRHRTIVCLDELRKRAHDVALLACNIGLASWDAKRAVRGWVKRCVTNPEQRVDSAEHALNTLRKFMHEQFDWTYGEKGRRRIEERTRAKYQREGGGDERGDGLAAVREARKHIAIGYA